MKQRILKILISLVLICSMAIIPIAAQASEPVYVLTVTADYARMRDQPVHDANIIATLRVGTKVLYLGDGGNMQCRVVTADGTYGYVYRGYLRVYGAFSRNRIGYNTADAALYVRDGEHLSRVATLPAGQFVYLLQLNGNWAYVRLMNGRTCYMQLTTLAKLP